MIESFRRGDWLTQARLIFYPRLLLVGFALAVAFLFVTSDGRMDIAGRPLGTDFSQVWAAGTFVLEGRPEKPFDNPAHFERERQLFGDKTQFYGWHYPPYFLAIAAVFALFPYALALILWQLGTLPLYLATVDAILRGLAPRGPVIVAALAFPAVFVNLGHGHNGFLTAGLLAGGLILLPKRSLIAGVLLGLLAYKPQFGLMLPVALLAGGYWRSIAAAAATVAAMTGATLLAFGDKTWLAFFDSLTFARQVVLEQGNTGWEKLQSAFAAVRMLGGSIPLAYAVQSAVTLVVALCLACLWHGRADLRLKSAALMAATLLTTPYCLDYDMMVLGPAIAFALAHGIEGGFAPYEKSVLALTWAMPLIARTVAGLTLLPFGFLTISLFFSTIIWRAAQDGAALPRPSPAGSAASLSPTEPRTGS
ncbi:MAG: DUF2029 domain-containing protein [Methylobacteriaceae bacterium]|nr:DUF2029 domain-containing protein [Methylobacteriaceae bacterium]